MMLRTEGSVSTAHGSKYLQQVCKHWGHKLTVEFDAQKGVVTFPESVVTMLADPDTLKVTIETESAETLERMKGVVARHLDRFAFREAPLPFVWS